MLFQKSLVDGMLHFVAIRHIAQLTSDYNSTCFWRLGRFVGLSDASYPHAMLG